MFFEKDYEIYPRTYSIKSYKRRESKLLKKLVNTVFYLSILAMIALIATMYVNK
jgi:hypothetical protein